MQIFSIRTRASIEISINDFGTDAEKEIWSKWSDEHPERRTRPDDLRDDGTGPLNTEIQQVIIRCLRQRYEHLHHQSRSPCTTADEMMTLFNLMSHLYAIVRLLDPIRMEWQAIY